MAVLTSKEMKLFSGLYEVRIPRQRIQGKLTDIADWFNERGLDDDWREEVFVKNAIRTYYFDREEDAVMFALRWA